MLTDTQKEMVNRLEQKAKETGSTILARNYREKANKIRRKA